MSDSEKKKKKKKEGKVSRLMMGFVLGGAVGSVLGATLSDKESRDLVKKKTLETWEKSRLLLGETIGKRKKDKKTLWHRLNNVFFGEDRGE